MIRRRFSWGLFALGILLFVWAWLFRFNEAEGSFAGLHDDHFFYLVRGWQMLFGDLPDRDFVDPGAPLTFAVAAAVQQVLGRGTWSEIVFCVTALSIGSVLTLLAAARASGSTLLAALAAIFQVALFARYYNYPKVIIYAVAVPALWLYLDRPTARRRVVLATITVVALLMRHDHGVFVGVAVLAAISLQADTTWRQRLQHGVMYAVVVIAMLSPYLAYLHLNGGIATHVITANSWSQRDRERAPLVLPTFASTRRQDEDPPANAHWWERGAFVQASRNYEPWLFWFIVALPVLALASLGLSLTRIAPDWPHARAKIAVLTLLSIMLDVGFLRGNLAARFGDVSVTSALLIAWIWRVAWVGGVRGWMPQGRRVATLPAALAVVTVVVTAAGTGVTIFIMLPSICDRLNQAYMLDGPTVAINRFQLENSRRVTWPLERWTPPDRGGSMALAYYIRDCTRPDDRVFISPYMPQVAALAQRAFAGGQADLRPGFFPTVTDQRLTIDRLSRQSVPVVVLPAGDDYAGFTTSFPRIDAFFATHYRTIGDADLGDGTKVRLLVRRDRAMTGTYRLHDWPCFQ